MLLSLRSSSQTQRYIYKKMMVCAQAVAITWSKLISDCCSNHSTEQHLWYADFSKALSWLSSGGDYKRTRQGALTALLLYLYKLHVVHATTISTSPYVHASTSYLITKATMPYTCALTSYSLISAVHVCTMCTTWGTHVSWRHP